MALLTGIGRDVWGERLQFHLEGLTLEGLAWLLDGEI